MRCPVCQSNIVQFLPHGRPPRPNVMCVVCRSKACHRLCWAWFNEHPEVFVPQGRFLHIAPEPELGRWIRGRCAQSQMAYQFGDIRDPQHRLDVMQLDLADQSVDVLFACHVLNMVPYDLAAMTEIFRVIKPGGLALLPVPIHADIPELIEALPTSSERDRERLFDDPFMFRKYTPSIYRDRLERTGFEVCEARPHDIRQAEADRWMLCDEWLQIGVVPIVSPSAF